MKIRGSLLEIIKRDRRLLNRNVLRFDVIGASPTTIKRIRERSFSVSFDAAG
jgi:hypothetical protein